MATENLPDELPKLSPRKFNHEYFLKHYLSSQDKNPAYKLNSYLKIVRKHLNRNLGRRPRLLDIGCGYGRFLKLAENEFSTIGIDPSDFVIDKANHFATRTRFERATLKSFSSKFKFDVITAFDVMEHVPNLNLSTEKIYRLLSPGGTFICVVPVYDGPLGKIGLALDHDPTHIHKLSRWQWFKLLGKKFKIIEVQGLVRYTFPGGVYFHVMSPALFRWGQAILVVMKK